MRCRCAPALGNVRAAAEVDELALPIERQRLLIGQAGFDVLDLEVLPQVAAECERFVARHFDPLERSSALTILAISASIAGKSSSEIGCCSRMS